jgi:carboxylate-amine ligase
MDASMIHSDARPSHHYPTVEIRVADACADSDDAVLIAALSRGLVETAAREYAAGKPAPPVPTALLRLANWQASKYGVSDQLLDPVAHRPTPARDVMDQLVAHVAPVLCESGDEPLVREGVKRVLAQGSGAARQREVLARTGSLACVVDHLARVTAGEC